MKKPVTSVPASILARLKNQAEILDRPFAEILQYYAMERFLYRLSKTKYAAKFILKGGLLFYVWNVPLRRPTKDIDFRGYVSNDSQRLLGIFGEVAAVSTPEDGLVFDLDSARRGSPTPPMPRPKVSYLLSGIPGSNVPLIYSINKMGR